MKLKPSKKKVKNYLIKSLLKDIEELEQKLTFKRLFLVRLISNQIPTKIEDYSDDKWYLSADDKEVNEHTYIFIKK